MQFILPALLVLAIRVSAECTCGYTVNGTQSNNYALFTEVFETDFLHIGDVSYNNSYSIGWEPQDYITPPAQADGPYGFAQESTNLVPNPLDSPYNCAGPARYADSDPGLQLFVRSAILHNTDNGLVPTAEIVSERDDILYGSFRIAMKTTAVRGTCASCFFYRNDSQEIDVEILSSDMNNVNKTWPVHLTVQNNRTDAQSLHSADWKHSGQTVFDLAFAPGGPSAEYHEYRFDWLPDRVDYYVDGRHIWTETESVPNSLGRLHINHWSNGNRFWSQGPPLQDAHITVSYVKAYFNSTNTTRVSEYASVCPSLNVLTQPEMCEIPNQDIPPNPLGPHGNTTGRTFFFTANPQINVNQTVYHNSASLSLGNSGSWLLLAATSLTLGVALSRLVGSG